MDINKRKNMSIEDSKKIIGAVRDLLNYKNEKYGNAALKPLNIFYKGDAQTSITIRLDDKLSRIMNCQDKIRKNDIADVVGYLFLLLISLGAFEDEKKQSADAFSKRLNEVCNGLYTKMTQVVVEDDTTPGVFVKEPASLINAQTILSVIHKSDALSIDNVVQLTVLLLQVMVEHNYVDLSEFKD